MALIAILPSTLAYTGTVVPDEIIIDHGSQSGSLNDLKAVGGGYVTWTAAYMGFFQHALQVNILFPEKSDVGTGNTLEIKFAFTGSN